MASKFKTFMEIRTNILPYPSKEHSSQTLQQQDKTLHVDQYTSLTLQSSAASAKQKAISTFN
jgi:hypothetical protein